jgi:hypothetical protein
MSIAVTASDPQLRPREGVSRATRVSTPAFDWTMTILSAVFVGGLFLDGWAHTHGRVDETFFTPWHAALYSGFLAAAVFLWGGLVWGVRRGHRWRAALPDGYGLSLLGVTLWFAGGPFDLAWHSVFGFEASVEALMSPAHTVLALGAALITSGPLRAVLRRRPRTWWRDLPLVLSLTFVVSVLTFFTQIAHPLANLWAAGPRRSSLDVTELGLVSFLLTAAIVMGPLLLLLRHGRLPTGAVAILTGSTASPWDSCSITATTRWPWWRRRSPRVSPPISSGRCCDRGPTAPPRSACTRPSSPSCSPPRTSRASR